MDLFSCFIFLCSTCSWIIYILYVSENRLKLYATVPLKIFLHKDLHVLIKEGET